MILDKIKEYLDSISIQRLSAEELKTITECAILIQKYNDDKVVRESIRKDLKDIHLDKV